MLKEILLGLHSLTETPPVHGIGALMKKCTMATATKDKQQMVIAVFRDRLTAELLQQTLNEEGEADKKLTSLAENGINATAAGVA
jgi:hypothetical protein